MGKVLLPSPSCFLIFDVVVHNPRSWLVGWIQNVELLSIIRCSDSAQSEQSVGYVVDGERLVGGCPQSSDDVWMPLLIGVGAPNHERDVELIFQQIAAHGLQLSAQRRSIVVDFLSVIRIIDQHAVLVFVVSDDFRHNIVVVERGIVVMGNFRLHLFGDVVIVVAYVFGLKFGKLSRVGISLVGIDVLSEQVEHHQVATLGSPWFREEVGHQLSVVGEGLATR